MPNEKPIGERLLTRSDDVGPMATKLAECIRNFIRAVDAFAEHRTREAAMYKSATDFRELLELIDGAEDARMQLAYIFTEAVCAFDLEDIDETLANSIHETDLRCAAYAGLRFVIESAGPMRRARNARKRLVNAIEQF